MEEKRSAVITFRWMMRNNNVDAMLHRAHLRYQRQRQASPAPLTNRMLVRERSKWETEVQWQTHWSTGLRPNFWRAFFETLEYMSKP
jgi:hypothetical protein